MADKGFYYDWLLPKMFAYSQLKGWEIPEHTPLQRFVLEDILARERAGLNRPEVFDMLRRAGVPGADTGSEDRKAIPSADEGTK
jgi:hypothetical protein